MTPSPLLSQFELPCARATDKLGNSNALMISTHSRAWMLSISPSQGCASMTPVENEDLNLASKLTSWLPFQPDVTTVFCMLIKHS